MNGIQYLSDLHLEFYTLTKLCHLLRRIPVRAPVLVIAGDLGNPFLLTYTTFVRWASRSFAHVVLILGNHEFHGHAIEAARARALHVAHTFPNIHVLAQSSFDLPDSRIRFLGTTLWTPRGDCDVGRIDGWTSETQRATHDSDVQWLASEIRRARREEKQLVVVTHHLPSTSLVHRKYAAFDVDDFASSCEHLFESPPIVCWIYGHTHTPSEHTMGDIRFATNPVGYPGENVCIEWGAVISPCVE